MRTMETNSEQKMRWDTRGSSRRMRQSSNAWGASLIANSANYIGGQSHRRMLASGDTCIGGRLHRRTLASADTCIDARIYRCKDPPMPGSADASLTRCTDRLAAVLFRQLLDHPLL